MTNQFITWDWILQEQLRMMRAELQSDQRFLSGDQWPSNIRAQRIAAGLPVLAKPITIPPSLLVAGLVVAVAAKVPFSRRQLLMPWKTGT